MSQSEPATPATSSVTTDRVIRVFISSTFRDMHAERNHLVTVIFPQLRRLCESRGVVWGEVDLRWGVPDESAAEGKVLPICLEEIQRCRPYFIGLLGERYGWVPQTIPDELLQKEEWLREQFKEHKSVTELEILHGVLRNPAMAGHAFFYFRDPAYVNTLPQEMRKDFTTEDTEGSEKLRRLKQLIRTRGLPVRENYPDPKILGELVLGDLTKVINDLYPEGSQPDPLTREALDHAAYARSRERVYIGRQEYFDRLDVHAAGKGDQPLVILGESGSGKSALVANWAARYRRAHPDAFVLEHFIGATPASADWTSMLRRIMGEFKQKLGIQQDIPDNPDALRSAFPNWLHMAGAGVQRSEVRSQKSEDGSQEAEKTEGEAGPAPRMSKIVLILDALNQLEDRDGAPDLLWLPPVMPENVRLIVSTLPGRALDETRKRHWPEMTVKLLDMPERKQLIAKYLAQFSKKLDSAPLDRIAAAPQTANPLYLRVLLDELRLFGIYEQLEKRIGYYLEAPSPYELYGKVIARWEEIYEGDTDLVGDTLSLLWAARRGLTESELLDALGSNGQPLPRAAWSPLFLAMADSLVSRGGLLTFAHDFLRTAAKDAYIPTEAGQQEVHTRLADYFERQPIGPRRIDELPWQLAEARAWQRLNDLLTNRNFFTATWDANQFEVKTYWTQIETGSSLRMVEAYSLQIEHPEMEPGKGYLFSLSILLDDAGHPEEALRLRSVLVQYFRDSRDFNNLQATLNNQALILKARGDLDGAMVLHKESERICRQLGNLDGLEATLGNQAVILSDRGDLDGAMVLYKEVERICRQLGNLAGLQAALGNQALILKARGDLDGAMALHKESERICRQLGNLDGLQAALGNQALILSNRGDLDGAMVLHKESERICRQLGNLAGLQRTLGNQANILYARGDLDGAMVLHKGKERICRQLGNLAGLQAALGNQAVILSNRGDLDGAMVLHKESERICRQLGNLAGLEATLGNQALILSNRGDLAGAMVLRKEEERICRQLGNLDGLQRTLGNQANILYARGDVDGAMVLHKEEERICRQLGNVEGLAGSLANQALMVVQQGRAQEGLRLAEEAHRLAVSHGYTALAKQIESIQEKIGDVLFAQGDPTGALRTYRESLGVRERFALSDPSNADWQRDLSVSHNKIGDVLLAQGDLTGALKAYRESLGVRESLVLSDPSNTGWQRDLSVSHIKIGDVLLTLGDLTGSLKAYRESLGVDERLVLSDPSNVGWQRDLSVSHNRIGNVLFAQGDLTGGLKAYRESLGVAERLALSDPSNTDWQRDMSVNHIRIGDVLLVQGDLVNVLWEYRANLQIIKRLAAKDRTNAIWKKDVRKAIMRMGIPLLWVVEIILIAGIAFLVAFQFGRRLHFTETVLLIVVICATALGCVVGHFGMTSLFRRRFCSPSSWRARK